MNVFALDIGDTRVGIAFADTNNKISTPLKVLKLKEIKNQSREFKFLMDDYRPELFVVGLPKSLDGTENKQAKHVRDVAADISNLYNIPLEFVDERLSSEEAKKILAQQNLSARQMKGKIDSVAASIFLNTWLGSDPGTDPLK